MRVSAELFATIYSMNVGSNVERMEMVKRQLNRLSARTVATKSKPGLYADGGGLYLQVDKRPNGVSKAWVFRYLSPITKRERYMGLGAIHAVGMPEARTQAAAQRGLLSQGIDPIQARDEEQRRRQAEAAKSATFKFCAEAFIDLHKAQWKNAKHEYQWNQSLKTYAYPTIGETPVHEVDTDAVLKILEPIWTAKQETASRLRGRIEAILDWAKVKGYRSGENPARWRGHLAMSLPTLKKRGRVKHLKAMPFQELPAFMVKLREMNGMAARCLEFTILTAARTNESTKGLPHEVGLADAVWTIPGSRMKAKVEHRVPLSGRALEIARSLMKEDQPCLFPSPRSTGRPISNMAMLQLLDRMGVDVTVHGFRSSFRDWASERTEFQHEVCEAALAHTINNQSEAAYRRGDLFEKRRKLMQAWDDFVNTPPKEGKIIPLKNVA